MYFKDNNYEGNLDNLFKKNKFNLKYVLISVILFLLVGVIIILFNDKKVEENEYYLVLNGNEDIIIEQYSSYNELGFMAYDSKGNDYNSQVQVIGEVNADIAGEYTITYTFGDIVKTRTILVVADDSQITYLVLKGTKVMYLNVGEVYKEPGYLVVDNMEADLTSKVKVVGSVNINAVGSYKIEYSVTNKSGKEFKAERTVIIKDINTNISYSPTNTTRSNVNININVTDNYFDYIVLPDNKKVSSRNSSYQVNENGTYKFIIYSKDGTYKEQEVVINNIDREAPMGSCNASTYRERTEVKVIVNGNEKISGYKYLIGGSSSNYINSNSYKANIGKVNRVSVFIKDELGNERELVCSVMDKSASEVRKIYVDSTGKQCLEGFTCYNQYNYSEKICSTDTCGPISMRGCSATSLSTILSLYGLKSKNGQIYTPDTLVREIYTGEGVCKTYCSGDTAMRRVVKHLGLSATETYVDLAKHVEDLKRILAEGTPVVFRVGKGAYTSGGHLMAILAINEEGKVFLADTGGAKTTANVNSKYKTNTWVDIQEIIKGAGESTWFMGVGSQGKYNS